jgi:hypothetical protein
MNVQGVEIGGIYRHWKGSYYQVVTVAHCSEGSKKAVVIYNKCDMNGIFQAIREYKDNDEVVYIDQPFFRDINNFTQLIDGALPRFKLVKSSGPIDK